MNRIEVRRPARRESVASYLLELALYAGLVTGYFFLVLHFMGGWLKHLFDDHKTGYAVVALGLIVGQGALLDWLTRTLLRVVRRWFD